MRFYLTIAATVGAAAFATFYQPDTDWDAEVINTRYALKQTAEGYQLLSTPGGEAAIVGQVYRKLSRGYRCAQIVPPAKGDLFGDAVGNYMAALCGRATAGSK